MHSLDCNMQFRQMYIPGIKFTCIVSDVLDFSMKIIEVVNYYQQLIIL